MAEIKVTYAKLNETADTIIASNSELKGILEEIKSIMDSLRGKWESEAAETYREQFNKISSNIEAYDREINKYCQFLERTAEEYRTVDSKVKEETSVLDNTSLFA